LTDVRELYSGIFTHTFLSVTRFIPGSAYSRALKIFPRLLAFVKQAPAFPEIVGLAKRHGIADEDIRLCSARIGLVLCRRARSSGQSIEIRDLPNI